MTQTEKIYHSEIFSKSINDKVRRFDPECISSSENIGAVFSKIDKCISDNSLIDKIKSGVLVGFSGGPDSILLLIFFYNLRKNIDFKLKAIHVNHGIRGEEADRDESFSRAMCEHLGIEFYSVYEDVPALSLQTGESIELAARETRYRIFSEYIKKDPSVSYIATAHNSSDNLETVIFNLMRGTGISGLCGINVSRDNIIRPMLYVSKSEVIEALDSVGAPYVVDSTNLTSEYTRNYIRYEIYPILKRLTPDPEKSVLRACSNLLDDSDYLSSSANEAYRRISGIEYNYEYLCKLHPAILSRVIVLMISAVGDKTPESIHIRSIMEHLLGGKDFEISLPGRLSFFKRGMKCFVSQGEDAFSFDRVILLSNGFTEIEELGIAVSLTDGEVFESSSNVYKISIKKKIDSAIIDGSIRLRTKREGDSYVYGGINRKLKKLFNNAKIALDQRSRVPVFEDDSGILWVPGFGLRDHSGDKSGSYKWITIFKK